MAFVQYSINLCAPEIAKISPGCDTKLHSWASNIPAKYIPQKNKTSHCSDKFRAVSPTGEQVDYTNLLQDTIKTEITHIFYPLYLNMVDVLMKASQLILLLLKGVKNHMA